MHAKIIEEALHILQNGGVIAHATDTCYGFATDIFNEGALKRLYTLKNMAETKPVSILVSSLAEAEGYAEFNDFARVLARKYWPGALTLILPRKKTLPDFLNRGVATVGIRVPNHPLSLELVKLFGRPITTTSANVTTCPSPYTVEQINFQFKSHTSKPDYIIDSGELSTENLPSTIIDLTQETPHIIRQGSLLVSEIPKI